MFNKILKAWKLLNNDIAIDMGSSTTRITVKGKDGIQLQEPSIVAVKNLLVIGKAGARNPNIFRMVFIQR